MQEIAKAAGVNQALLHYYFRSKGRLAEAVFSEAAAGPSAESALEVLLPGGARVMLSNPAQVAPLARLLQALAEPC